ncbi:MAG: DNA gyrase inhibitor YacG [Pirellulaceae bacterium]|nr:DNA gyrase inhibitor YacG [Pirellulaceae bacterium]
MSNSIVTLNCPTCKRPYALQPIRKSMPFCSHRCQMADLGRWMNEEVGLPCEESDDGPEDEQPPTVREWRFD